MEREGRIRESPYYTINAGGLTVDGIDQST